MDTHKGNPKPTLMEIVDLSNEIIRQIVEAGGEVTPELEERLSLVANDLMKKVDGYSAALSRLDGEKDFWKERALMYERVAKACSQAKDFLKEKIKSAMLQLNVTRLEGPESKFTLSEGSPKVVVDDPNKVPDFFKKEVVTVSVDKVAIKKAWKNDQPIPGVHLEKVVQLRSSVNRRN